MIYKNVILGSHHDGAIIGISKNITYCLGKGNTFMAQMRRGELPPLRDPRTLGNRHKTNAPQPPSMRKNQDGVRRSVTGRHSPRGNMPSRAVPIVPQRKSHSTFTQKSTNPTTQPAKNKRGTRLVQRDVPTSYNTHRNSSGKSSGNTHSKKSTNTDTLKNHVHVTDPKKTQGKIQSKTDSDSSVKSRDVFTSVENTAQDAKQNTSRSAIKNAAKHSEEKHSAPKVNHDDNNVHCNKKKHDVEAANKSNASFEKDPHSEKSQRDTQGKDNVSSDNVTVSIDNSTADSNKEEGSGKKSKFKDFFNYRKIKGDKEDRHNNTGISVEIVNDIAIKNNHSVLHDEDGAPLEKPKMSVHPIKEKVKRHDPNAASAVNDIKGYSRDASRDASTSQVEENTEHISEGSTEGADSLHNSKIIVPKSNIDTKKRKKPVFLIFVNIWVFLIVVAIIALTALGFVWWNNTSLDKQKSIAYNQGYQNAFDKPTVENVVRNSAADISDLILSTPGNGYPSNAVLSDFYLEGWTTPGGNEGHGRANIAVCYTGDGVNEALQSYVYLVSDNSGAQHPKWSVDSIHVTGDKCVPQKEGK